MTPFRRHGIALTLALILSWWKGPSVALATEPGPVIFLWDWASSVWYSDIELFWTKSFSKPATLYGQQVHNCDGLMRALDGRPLTFDISATNQQLLACATATALGNLTQPTHMLFNGDTLTRDVFRHLDVGSMPWSLGKGLNKEGSFTMAEAKLKMSDPTDNQRLWVRLGEHDYQLNFVAMGDFLGDGKQSVYCEFEDNPVSGKEPYFQGAVWLRRDAKGGPIRAEPIVLRYPQYLHPSPWLRNHMEDLSPPRN
jgi:hypothetical protein